MQTNGFEGVANGTAITTTNSATSGSGFAYISGTTGGTSALTFSTDTAAHGTTAAKLALVNNESKFMAWTLSNPTQLATRFYLRFPVRPTTFALLHGVLNVTDADPGAAVYLGSGGNLLLQAADGGATFNHVTTRALAVDTWYRVELLATQSSSRGRLQLALYLGDSTTPLETYDSGTTLNTGPDAFANVRFGRLTGGTTANRTYYFDDLAVSEGATAYLGPASSDVAPHANAGPDQSDVEPWLTVTLSGTDSDTDGTVVARAWTQTAGAAVTLSGASTATATFPAPGTLAGTSLTFTYTVTDNGGESGSDTVNVGVLPVTERAVIGGVEVPMQVR